MAKKKGEGPSKSSYWRVLFRAEPHHLKVKSNKVLVERWIKDHPGRPFDKSQSQALANVKSMMRKSRKKGGRPKAEATVDGGVVKPAPVTQAALERLEISIDHCLSKARDLDSAALEKAIKYLRAARNAVVWQSGQP